LVARPLFGYGAYKSLLQVAEQADKNFNMTIIEGANDKKKLQAGLWESESLLVRKFFSPNSSVLCVNCGEGRAVIELYEMGFGAAGIDEDPENIRRAKKFSSEKNHDIEYMIGMPSDFKLSACSFKNAFFTDCGWSKIKDGAGRSRALKEIYRIIDPGGFLIFNARVRHASVLTFFAWFMLWIKFYLLRPIGFMVEEHDFGDRFFKADKNGRRFFHFSKQDSILRKIKNSGFELIFSASLKKISKNDMKKKFGKLAWHDNRDKTLFFYVCRKN
jgi:SAM-dependent methyltransferase